MSGGKQLLWTANETAPGATLSLPRGGVPFKDAEQQQHAECNSRAHTVVKKRS